MVLPLLAGAGLMAAAGTVGNRFFQDYANERTQRRQGAILGGILDESQGPDGLNYNLFGQNLLGAGFNDLGGQFLGQDQRYTNQRSLNEQQHGFSMAQIGARAGASQRLAQMQNEMAIAQAQQQAQFEADLRAEELRLKASLAENQWLLQQSFNEPPPPDGTFELSASETLDYTNMIEEQSQRMDSSAQLGSLIGMIKSGERFDITGDRAGVMDTLRFSAYPILQEKLNSGTLNEGEQELYDALIGKTSGFFKSFQSTGTFTERQLGVLDTLLNFNNANINNWNNAYGGLMSNARDPGGNPMPTARTGFSGFKTMTTPNGDPLTLE